MPFSTSSTQSLSYDLHPLQSFHPYELLIQDLKAFTLRYLLTIKSYNPLIIVSTFTKVMFCVLFLVLFSRKPLDS
jgi:hypothetical protein